jgi:hypothetical protein
VAHFVSAVGRDRFEGESRYGSRRVPAVLARERGGLESEEAVHRGRLRLDGPGALGARPHDALERGVGEGGANGKGAP